MPTHDIPMRPYGPTAGREHPTERRRPKTPTVDIHIRYLNVCFGGRVTATATVRRAGKRIVHLDATVTGDDGTEYASAVGVFAVTPARG